MEHRWGERSLLNVSVRLDARPQALACGRLRDASVSGAFVETSCELPLWTRVVVELEWGRFQRSESHRIAAYVARRDRGGFGLEWCELAPQPVVALLRRAAATDCIPKLAARAARSSLAFSTAS